MSKIKLIGSVFFLFLLGGVSVIFGVLYLETFSHGLLYRFRTLFTGLIVGCCFILTALSVISRVINKDLPYKLSVMGLAILTSLTSVFYLLAHFDLLSDFRSIASLRSFISEKGKGASFIFIFLQFAQVVFLPIPSALTTAAGIACFGTFYGLVYSLIGILAGSYLAFFIGRKWGVKAVSWIVGENMVEKWMDKIRGKDKLFLTFMFIMPFFPDDVLCFIAGLSTMNTGYYFKMITGARVLSLTVTCLVLGGNIIPFNTPIGLTIWTFFFIIICGISVLFYYKSDAIQKKILNRFTRKKDER